MRQFIAWCAVLFTAVLLAACSGGEDGGGNGKPSANADTAKTRLNLQRDIDVLANDTDPDGDALALTSVTQGTLGTVSIVGNVVRYTPNVGQSGPDAFSYSVTDANGGNVTGSVSIMITTATSNTSPQAVPDIVSTAIGLTSVHDVMANDTDADGDPLTLSIVTPPSNGTASVLPDLRIQYVHTGATTSVDVLEYQIDDGLGGTARAFVALVINQTLILPGSNDPQAINDSGTLNPGTFLDINVLSNDFNPGGLTLSVASFSQPSLGQGSVTDQGGGVLRYTAIGGAAGSDFFFYTITLPNSIVLAAYVYITINDAPVAVDDFYEVDPGQIVNLPVLLNDSDPNGDPLSITANTTPATGTLFAPVNGVFNYVAASSPHVIAMFTYTIEDPLGRSDTGTVTIGVSNPPVANNDSASGGATIDVNVLTNDTDPDMDALSVKSFTQGTSGIVTDQGGGVLRYKPNTGFEGLDTFTYVCQDVFLRTASATVSVVVNDFTPPAVITNLTVLYSSTPDTVTLRWTSTGDSGTVGTATSYVIKTATFSFTSAVFDSMTTVTQSLVPKSPGQIETLTIPMTWYTGPHFFAIKALDEIPNASAMSNLAQANLNSTGLFPASPSAFGSVAYNSTSDTNYQIQNTAIHSNLVISSLDIAGGGPFSVTVGAISSTPVSLAPGAIHNFTVRFGPTAQGNFNATVAIVHNGATPASPFNLNVSGTGANLAPTYRVRSEIMTAGPTVNFQIDISDGNSVLPGTDDLATAEIDLTPIGGSGFQALAFSSTVNSTTKRFTAGAPTTGLAPNVYLLQLRATDVNGNSARGHAVLIIRTGNVVTVGPGQAFTEIQPALNAAVQDDVVLVREGTYTGSNNGNLSFFGKRVTVVAEFSPLTCIIDHANSYPGFHLTGTGDTRATWIVGMNFLRCSPGIFLDGNTSPSIACCHFEDCTQGIVMLGQAVAPAVIGCTFEKIERGSAGLSFQNQNSNPRPLVKACDLHDNQRPIEMFGGSAELEDCVIERAGTLPAPFAIRNFTDGTTPALSATTLTMSRCMVRKWPLKAIALEVRLATAALFSFDACVFEDFGDGQGIQILSESTVPTQVEFKNCAFRRSEQSALHVDFYAGAHLLNVENCLFDDCSTTGNGPALFVRPRWNGSTVSIGSTTFYGTGTPSSATAAFSFYGDIQAGTLAMQDCVFRANAPVGNNELQLSVGSGTIVNCCVGGNVDVNGSFSLNGGAGWVPGTNGNINADALFVDAANGNFRLQQLAAGQAADSPCIDAGSQTAAAAGLASKTTRTDSVLDAGVLDMGYHYDP